MENNIPKSKQRTSNIAKISLLLGIGSLVVLIASIVVGILVKSVGIVSFFGAISIFALGAIICGIIARGKAIFIFFIPWLGA